MTGFQIDVDHNQYLSEGDTVVDAIVTVTASGEAETSDAGVEAAEFAQIIMIDCSGSMSGSRIAEAKRATLATIDALDDGSHFAIIAGTALAQMVYPKGTRTIAADERTRRQARDAVDRLRAGGGTAMGTWLSMAARILAACDAKVKYGLLLTDGDNQHEPESELRRHLDSCEDVFVCNACGIGSDWNAAEVRLIADRLHGEADGLPEPERWAQRLTELTSGAMRKTVPDVALRVFTPARNTIRFVKQMSPHIADLTDRRRELDDKTGDYATGAWGGESREFHISVEVPPIRIGDDRLAARITAVAHTEELADGMVTARWTGDQLLSTRINPRVALHTGQAELAVAIQAGVAAARRGDIGTASDQLAKAVRLADKTGNANTARLLSKVVEIDPATGAVQMKSTASAIDLEMADVASVKTVTVRRSSS